VSCADCSLVECFYSNQDQPVYNAVVRQKSPLTNLRLFTLASCTLIAFSSSIGLCFRRNIFTLPVQTCTAVCSIHYLWQDIHCLPAASWTITRRSTLRPAFRRCRIGHACQTRSGLSITRNSSKTRDMGDEDYVHRTVCSVSTIRLSCGWWLAIWPRVLPPSYRAAGRSAVMKTHTSTSRSFALKHHVGGAPVLDALNSPSMSLVSAERTLVDHHLPVCPSTDTPLQTAITRPLSDG
jgi:hypothetical protein